MTVTVFLDRDEPDVDTGGMSKIWAITALEAALNVLDPPSSQPEAADEGDDDEDD